MSIVNRDFQVIAEGSAGGLNFQLGALLFQAEVLAILIPHYGNRATGPSKKKYCDFFYEENYLLDIFVKTKL